MLTLPATINGKRYCSLDPLPLVAIDGSKLGAVSGVPGIKVQEIVDQASEKLQAFQRISAQDVWQALAAVGRVLRSTDWQFAGMSRRQYCVLVNRSTGLPISCIEEDLLEIADWLQNCADVCGVQLPMGSTATLERHEYTAHGHVIAYFPAGSSLAVRVPGNIPSICTYWLQPLALKRPVIVVPSEEDPFTHAVLVEALHTHAPWLSAFLHFVPCTGAVFSQLLARCDQIVMSQSLNHLLAGSAELVRKTFLIHYGRTKLFVCGPWSTDVVNVALRRMFWRHGRTCTGLTSVVTTRGGWDLAVALSRDVEKLTPLETEVLLDSQPAFPVERARLLHEHIESLIERGDVVDVTRRVDARCRLVEANGRAVLLPTVLWVRDNASEAFGLELPFPFVTVAEAASDEEARKLVRDTLILSVVGADREITRGLCYDSSIRKVFSGPHVERGYDRLDPHEGYMADFLYQKKAVWPACDA